MMATRFDPCESRMPRANSKTRPKPRQNRTLHVRLKTLRAQRRFLNSKDTSKNKPTRISIMIRSISVATQRQQLVVLIFVASLFITLCQCDTRRYIRGAPTLATPAENSKQVSRESLMSSLSESIERQHLKLGPIRALIQQRPSKFDSGDISSDKLISLPSPKSAHLQYKQDSGPSRSSNKAEDEMRNILMMHELANQRIINHSSKSAKLDTESDVKEPNISWLNIVKNPAQVANKLISSSKAMSQVLSYISPLTSGAKLKSLKSTELARNLTKLASIKMLRARAATAFTGRATNEKLVPNIKLNKQRLLSASKPHSSSRVKTVYVDVPDPSKFEQQNALKQLNSVLDQSKYLKEPNESLYGDLMADPSKLLVKKVETGDTAAQSNRKVNSMNQQDSNKKSSRPVSSWIMKKTNDKAHNYLQESIRDLLVLSQLPLFSSTSASTAPSVLETVGRPRRVGHANNTLGAIAADESLNRRVIDELLRYAYLLVTGVSRKRDPLKALASSPNSLLVGDKYVRAFIQRSIKKNIIPIGKNFTSLYYPNSLKSLLLAGLPKNATSRGIMWEMATDPSLAVTVFHLLERASVALPLGFLLMPLVQMVRNPFNNINFGSLVPPRASHRSIDIEELAKRLDLVDRMLSRALRPTHRSGPIG